METEMTIEEQIKKIVKDANIMSVANGEITVIEMSVCFNIDNEKTLWYAELTESCKVKEGSIQVYPYENS